MDAVRKIADAVLYEGYILWPYRKSALKNQRRFGFGTIEPGGFNQTECLLEAGDDVAVEVTVRFLQLVERQLWRAGEPVEELEIEGELHQSWEEAAEREVRFTFDTRSCVRVPVEVAQGARREGLGPACRVERSWGELRGSVEADSERLRDGQFRLRVRTENAGPEGEFRSAHTVLLARDGQFVSLTDPAPELQDEAAACDNAGLWPVLAGEEGDRSTLLASPIILPDHPEIAPESPGDLFDATEIDQMLVLNILSLTDEERRQMRSADPRAREILERTESLNEEELMRLHGTIREFGLARRP